MRDSKSLLNLVVVLCVGTIMMQMLMRPEFLAVVAILSGAAGAALVMHGLMRQAVPALQPAVIRRQPRR